MSYIAVVIASAWCILLELFFTRILNLKAWNHVVYVVIPFAMLGYGIGANLYLLTQHISVRLNSKKVLSSFFCVLSLFTLLCTLAIMRWPLQVNDLLNIFINFRALTNLLCAYLLYMTPFICIGFLVVYLFSLKPDFTYKMYFYDLIGAGLGAILFYPLINNLAVFRSLLFLSIMGLMFACVIWIPKLKKFFILLVIFIYFLLRFIPEPQNYVIDSRKGWEWIPGYYSPVQYELTFSRWHALGKTDLFRMKDADARTKMVKSAPGTFEVNILPPLEFSYFSTNYLSGTPVYNFADLKGNLKDPRVKLFSQAMEVPYVLLAKPKVLVIGPGGGRDIFMAKTHGATEVLGAEINPAIYEAMSPGGPSYDYSGHIYTFDGTQIYNIDGRHLVKRVPANSLDLIILNGVDTFSALSSGAYAYAESYLYTKNAVMDYLKALKPNGVLNFNRWLFADMPRETLRLHAISLDALKSIGAQRPWEHIIIGQYYGWSLMLIKKEPFRNEEIAKVIDYFHKHGVRTIYPSWRDQLIQNDPLQFFDLYAMYFQKNLQEEFARFYPFDISVITDDNPFFYKYYKFDLATIRHAWMGHHTGTIIFLTQFLILIEALVLILLFIFVPLILFRKKDLKAFPTKALLPFVLFFSCLGIGFMFIEISMMQRFVLLLGSPIYSITVILATLLVAAGIGSITFPILRNRMKNPEHLLTMATIILSVYIFILRGLGIKIFDYFMYFSLFLRIVAVIVILSPLAFFMGFYFPYGLVVISKNFKTTVPWAWGINCGRSVLGSIFAIIIAQFIGFNAVLLLAVVLYLIGLLAIKQLEKVLPQ